MPVSADERALINRLDSFPSVEVVAVPSAESRPWWMSLGAVVALVVLGTLLRGAAWLGDRNLWIDESMLALNLIERSPARLLEPLDWNQGAPVGFLLASKAAISQLGTGERALRFLPMLGSLWGLAGFAWLAPRLMPRSTRARSTPAITAMRRGTPYGGFAPTASRKSTSSGASSFDHRTTPSGRMPCGQVSSRFARRGECGKRSN